MESTDMQLNPTQERDRCQVWRRHRGWVGVAAPQLSKLFDDNDGCSFFSASAALPFPSDIRLMTKFACVCFPPQILTKWIYLPLLKWCCEHHFSCFWVSMSPTLWHRVQSRFPKKEENAKRILVQRMHIENILLMINNFCLCCHSWVGATTPFDWDECRQCWSIVSNWHMNRSTVYTFWPVDRCKERRSATSTKSHTGQSRLSLRGTKVSQTPAYVEGLRRTGIWNSWPRSWKFYGRIIIQCFFALFFWSFCHRLPMTIPQRWPQYTEP